MWIGSEAAVAWRYALCKSIGIVCCPRQLHSGWRAKFAIAKCSELNETEVCCCPGVEMALGKHIRSEKRFNLPVTIGICIAFFLLAVWLFSAPSAPKHASSPEDVTWKIRSSPSVQDGPRSVTNQNKVGAAEDEVEAEAFDTSETVANVTTEESEVDEPRKSSKDDAEIETEPKKSKDDAEIENEPKGSGLSQELSSVDEAELGVENKESPGSLVTQAKESSEEKEANAEKGLDDNESGPYNWKLCPTGADYVPCLDNTDVIKRLKSTKHYEHRERHCPSEDEKRLCLVPVPVGYKAHVPWPRSRDEVWFNNVPHPGLVSYKADQNWVKKEGEVLVFPGGGTQFKKGAIHYIDYVEKTLPDISWGKRTRVILDVGCGVASFGGYLFEKDVLALSFAPKDEHEAQVQLALERGIPAISAVMGTQRLPFPSNVYDMVHCARCRVPWHLEGAKLLLELNRVLRPGGYFVWSATPVYQRAPEDVGIWKETTAWAAKLCWKRLARTKDPQTGIGVAIFQKPVGNTCYERRAKNEPPLCEEGDRADAAWYVPLKGCIHRIPVEPEGRATTWPQEWPSRLEANPKWLDHLPKGLYGKPAAEEFQGDTEHWKHVVQKSYERGLGINWDSIRNVMDMKAGYGGFGAALASLPVWVMNVVPINEPETLPIIFDRGLFGIYHDWCESFSTYPRTYDLLHADHLFMQLRKRCNATYALLEMDRILRPEGWIIFRDNVEIVKEIEPIVKSLHWDVKVSYSQDKEQLLAVQKKMWRPEANI